MFEQMIAQIAQGMLAPSTPAVVVNTHAVGGPVEDLDDDKLYGGVYPDYGEPEDYDNDLPDFGAPFETDDIRLQIAPTNYGGPIDAVAGLFTSATTKTINALGGATKKALGEVAKEVKALKSRDGAQQRQINKIMADLKAHMVRFVRTEQRWAQYFGKKGRITRASLFAATKMLGLRAVNILSSAQFAALVAYVEFIGKQADDFGLGSPVLDPVPEVPATDTYNTATMDNVRDALVARDVQLAAAIAAIVTYLEDQAGAANDAKLKEAMGSFKTIIQKDLFTQIASLTPGQLQDREQAIGESVLSYFLGQPRSPGAPLLSSGLI